MSSKTLPTHFGDTEIKKMYDFHELIILDGLQKEPPEVFLVEAATQR